MTRDRETAVAQLVDQSARYNALYLYQLLSGHFYISSTPPAMMNAEFVASASRGVGR